MFLRVAETASGLHPEADTKYPIDPNHLFWEGHYFARVCSLKAIPAPARAVASSESVFWRSNTWEYIFVCNNIIWYCFLPLIKKKCRTSCSVPCLYLFLILNAVWVAPKLLILPCQLPTQNFLVEIRTEIRTECLPTTSNSQGFLKTLIKSKQIFSQKVMMLVLSLNRCNFYVSKTNAFN